MEMKSKTVFFVKTADNMNYLSTLIKNVNQ